MKRELIAHEDPKSYVSELFRTLRTNVQFMNSNKSLKTLLVTSTLPGEGKTWVSSNLAITFAQTGKKVVLIDADMRKCCLHNIFKVAPYPGLSNLLAGINDNPQKTYSLENYLRNTEVPNLFLIPSGNVPPNPSELLSTPQMSALLDELKRNFDLIIIDGTPSKLVTDAVILSRVVDSTIIVTAHNMTKKDDLTKVIKDIKNVGGHIAGVVYNKKPVSGRKANETYYYASAPIKIDAKRQEELEYERRRQIQRSRTTEMLNRDRNPKEYQKEAIAKQKETESAKPQPQPKTHQETQQELRQTVQKSMENSGANTEMSPEERATEILKQFNDYLQKEKENMDKRNF